MITRKRKLMVIAVVALIAVVGAGVGINTSLTSASSPGQIDDGAELLPLANITLEEAIAAAQAAETGALGEVDLEMYLDRLVFNVDIGEWDIKVDATDGSILGKESDD